MSDYTMNTKVIYFLVFPATRGQSYSGDIAIDDLLFTGCGLPPVESSCKPEQFTCTRGSCTKKEYQCDFNDDCGDSSDEVNCGTFQLLYFSAVQMFSL